MVNEVVKQDETVRAVQIAHLPPRSEAMALVDMIERLASDPSINIERLEKIMQMRENLRKEDAARRAEENEQAFHAAMAAAQAEMPIVSHNSTNTHTKSNYANLSAIHAALMPVIHKHGFDLSFSQADCPKPGHYRIVCRTSNKGHTQIDQADIPIDGGGFKGAANKTDTHAFGSTMSYGRRYLTLMIFNVATRDDDGNAAGKSSSEVITDDQAAGLTEALTKGKLDIAKFLAMFEIDAIGELPANRFVEAKKEIDQAIAFIAREAAKKQGVSK